MVVNAKEAQRQKERDDLTKKIKVGSPIYSVHCGLGVVEKINKKTISILLSKGGTILQDKCFCMLPEDWVKRGGHLPKGYQKDLPQIHSLTKSSLKKPKSSVSKDGPIYSSEKVKGITIEYLSDWSGSLEPTVSFASKSNEKRVTLKELQKGYTKKVVDLAIKYGFKRVRIGTIGDFYSAGLSSGKMIGLDTMNVASFLKI